MLSAQYNNLQSNDLSTKSKPITFGPVVPEIISMIQGATHRESSKYIVLKRNQFKFKDDQFIIMFSDKFIFIILEKTNLTEQNSSCFVKNDSITLPACAE